MKMKEFYAGEKTYIVSPCSAIAASAGDTERQDAVYVALHGDSGEIFEWVYFGVKMPTTNDGFRDAFLGPNSWEDSDTNWETLETVVFQDGTTPKDYAF